MPSITNATNVVRGVVVGYQYVVLRCVPRVEREEFVNVGVVLYAQGADFLDAAFAVDEARLRSLYPELEVPRVLDALRSVRSVCRGETGLGRPTLDTPGQRFGWLSAPRSTVVQPGPRHGGICTDPAIELDRLVLSLVSGIRSRDGDRVSAESS